MKSNWKGIQFNLSKRRKKRRILGGPIGRAVTESSAYREILEKAAAFDSLIQQDPNISAELENQVEEILRKAAEFDALSNGTTTRVSLPPLAPIPSLPPIPPLPPLPLVNITVSNEPASKLKVIESKKALSDTFCPYCREGIEPSVEDATRCKYCSALQHEECIEENRGNCTSCSNLILKKIEKTTRLEQRRYEDEPQQRAVNGITTATTVALIFLLSMTLFFKLWGILPLTAVVALLLFLQVMK